MWSVAAIFLNWRKHWGGIFLSCQKLGQYEVQESPKNPGSELGGETKRINNTTDSANMEKHF